MIAISILYYINNPSLFLYTIVTAWHKLSMVTSRLLTQTALAVSLQHVEHKFVEVVRSSSLYQFYNQKTKLQSCHTMTVCAMLRQVYNRILLWFWHSVNNTTTLADWWFSRSHWISFNCYFYYYKNKLLFNLYYHSG